MYSLKHISVVIPTYNRAKDLEETLNSFKPFMHFVGEIIIVDQSTDQKTKELVKKLKNKKLKYLFSSTPSITKSRNLGIKNISKNARIVSFFDDDVTLGGNYFQCILEIFNAFPEAKGVAGMQLEKTIPAARYELLLKKLFFLQHIEKEGYRALSSYGNTSSNTLREPINSEWLPGVNMSYKTEVFSEQLFDENLSGYALAEDYDFSYRLYKKHPKSLFITPHAKIVHRVSSEERYPTKKISYMNQINHFYLNFKNFNETTTEKIRFIWSIFGISILRIAQFVRTRRKLDAAKMKMYFSSLVYVLLHLKRIKKGILTLPE